MGGVSEDARRGHRLASDRWCELSLDHDLGLLGGERELTGYEVVTWMERAVATEGFVPLREIHVHSTNASAAPKMERGIESIRRLADRSSEA
jgi:hypothetical protein